MDKHHSKKAKLHCITIAHLMTKQHLKIKSSIMDINNCLNEIYHLFDSLNEEISSGFRLIDIFSDCFSFISVNWKDSKALVAHKNRLNNIYRDFLTKYDTVFIISSVSIKSNITTSISHIWRGHEIIIPLSYKTYSISSLSQMLFLLLEKYLI